ncbi:MAG: ATP-binding cassette domain-containing protein [Planctomycetota bacterium]
MLCEVADLEVVREGRPALSLDRVVIERDGPTMISGPNASGKTTLLAVLGALVAPARGRVEVLQTRIWPAAEPARRAFRRRVVMCETEPLFFHGSVARNVAYGLRGIDVGPALEAVGALHLAARRPYTLSSGERRRADLARALVRRPRLLLLDEPTSHLDEAGARWVVTEIERLCADGTAVIFSNHADDRLRAIAHQEVALRSRPIGYPEGAS